MGLDMYLNKRTNIRSWEGLEPELRHKVTVEGPKTAHIKPNKVVGIVEEAMYWRKANAIHAWFVKNVQDGVDNCEEYEVRRDMLVCLRDTCHEVLADTTSAATLLPPQGGFFFGSTEINEWYWQEVERTEQELDALLTDTEDLVWDVHFYYRSSW